MCNDLKSLVIPEGRTQSLRWEWEEWIWVGPAGLAPPLMTVWEGAEKSLSDKGWVLRRAGETCACALGKRHFGVTPGDV